VGNKDLDFGGKKIMVTDGALGTVIDCEGSGRGFWFHTGEDRRSVVRGLTIRNGSAVNGGGILCESSPTIIDCIVADCSSLPGSEGGGGIYLGEFSAGLVERCHVLGNSTSHDGHGGGIYCRGPGATIRNSVIAENDADFGDGIYLRHEAEAGSLIENCVIRDNAGVGIDLEAASPTIRNSIVWGNEGGSFMGFSFEASVSYSFIEGGYTGPGAGAGIQTDDPMFYVDKYHVLSNSPCIDAGDPEHCPGLDIDREARTNQCDVGVDEYIDLDRDGMPGWWERLYGLDPNDPTGDHGAQGDPDSGGVVNIDEYVAGTDPLQAVDTDDDGMSDEWEVRAVVKNMFRLKTRKV